MELIHSKIDFDKDLNFVLERHCRINYQCESEWVYKENNYLKYRNDWFNNKEQIKNFLDAIRTSVKDNGAIAEIIKNEKNENIGYIWMSFSEDKESDFLCANIQDIYIEEEFRNRGIATTLMNYLEGVAKNKGATIIRSGTGAQNNSSLNLHNKLGFKIYRYEFEKKL